MIGLRLPVLFAALLLALPVEGAKPQPPAKPEFPPMSVVIVRSALPGCEPDCPQWISAEGMLTPATPALFRKALKQASGLRLPVIIHSPGGDVNAAIAIGSMIKQAKLDVAVGWTLFDGCKPGDKSCKLPRAQNGVYRGLVFSYRAYCASACPLVLAAGERRLVGGGALAGVHQMISQRILQRLIYREKFYEFGGQKQVISRELVGRKTVKSYMTTKVDPALLKTIKTYLATTGVNSTLLDLFQLAPPSSIHVMTSEELTSTGLMTEALAATELVAPTLCKKATPAVNCRHVEPPKP
ncbi:MAG: hypothetical protein HY245_09505 [Rhizobiales bacterium]|nr:hypothetical protein [Hyphomicrobiales bacterium]MBI3673637.1 hypothetical protein [Hyphomicrobiales bacterium]